MTVLEVQPTLLKGYPRFPSSCRLRLNSLPSRIGSRFSGLAVIEGAPLGFKTSFLCNGGHINNEEQWGAVPPRVLLDMFFRYSDKVLFDHEVYDWD